jgi:hypothetical protein
MPAKPGRPWSAAEASVSLDRVRSWCQANSKESIAIAELFRGLTRGGGISGLDLDLDAAHVRTALERIVLPPAELGDDPELGQAVRNLERAAAGLAMAWAGSVYARRQAISGNKKSRRLRTEAQCIAEWMNFMGKRLTPTTMVMAEIDLGFDNPCSTSDEFAARHERAKKFLARNKISVNPATIAKRREIAARAVEAVERQRIRSPAQRERELARILEASRRAGNQGMRAAARAAENLAKALREQIDSKPRR